MAKCFRGFIVVSGLIVFSVIVHGCSAADPSKGEESGSQAFKANLKVDLPAALSVKGRRSLNCRSLMETDLTGSHDRTLTDGLEGKVTPGQNKFSISVEDRVTLIFLSEAAFAAGSARGEEFKIIANNDSEMVAYFFNGTSMNSFVLNKTSPTFAFLNDERASSVAPVL